MKAFITGITGQDGYYLSKLLLQKGYEVHGIVRRNSSINTSRIDPLIAEYNDSKKLNLHYSDLMDSSSLNNLIKKINPDEIYNLAAQSHVAVSFQNPYYSAISANAGIISILEAIKNEEKDIKFYQASSSEMYGGKEKVVLNEDSVFMPKSPYAASKVFSHNLTQIYRESYDLFGVNGILFNHESPHRGETFVTRKITRAVGRIYHGLQDKLTLGNLDASRDWGFAGDYVKGMYLMMQQETPSDWVLATGETHTVREFLIQAFKYVDIDWEKYVQISDKYFRPNEVEYLLGDATKANKILGWQPETTFEQLVELMVKEDLLLAEREKVLIENNLLKPTWENPTK